MQNKLGFIFISDIIQVGIFMRCIETRTRLRGIQVMMSDNQGAGVAPVQLFEQLSHGSLLFSRPRVGGLTADYLALHYS